MENVRRITFDSFGNEQGQLVPLEEMQNVPFEVKRVYYIVKTVDDVTRGKHAHRHLEQVLICVNGSFKLRVDNGRESETIVMDTHNEGVYLGHDIWREMSEFTPGTVLLVLASEHYDPTDYIRDYDEFKKYVLDKEK